MCLRPQRTPCTIFRRLCGSNRRNWRIYVWFLPQKKTTTKFFWHDHLIKPTEDHVNNQQQKASQNASVMVEPNRQYLRRQGSGDRYIFLPSAAIQYPTSVVKAKCCSASPYCYCIIHHTIPYAVRLLVMVQDTNNKRQPSLSQAAVDMLLRKQ